MAKPPAPKGPDRRREGQIERRYRERLAKVNQQIANDPDYWRRLTSIDTEKYPLLSTPTITK